MRPSRTPHEQKAIDALKAKLIDEYQAVAELEEITDMPDAAFVLDETTVACECRIFAPEKLLRLHGVEMIAGELYHIFLPVEPHMWVRNAIEAKSPKIEAYKQRCGASQVWLLLHTLRGISEGIASPEAHSALDAYRIGAFHCLHSFDRIYIMAEEEAIPVCVYDVAATTPEQRRHYEHMDIEIIPVAIRGFGTFVATEGPNGHGMITIPMNNPTHRVMLQPLDHRFSVDYSGVGSLDFSNIGRGRESPKMFAKRVTQ